MPPTQSTGTVLFVDISGSTRLYETLGDERALTCVSRTLRMLAAACTDCGGRVIRTTGDGALCLFETADAALRAAYLMQERTDEQQEPGEPGLGIHVGCHFGSVLESAGDLYGDTVNLAARVAGLAKVGQIITTADTVVKLSPLFTELVRKLDRVPVKGKQEEVTIFEFLWQDSEELTTAFGTRPDYRRTARIRLKYEGREWRFEGPGELTFGRDGACDIVVGDRKASRRHARLERRRDKFVLADHSSNGTWVRFTGEPQEVVLRREELMLRTEGLIGFGHSPVDGQGAPVEFSSE
ncbi:MAG TPA: adenylate/guanylate cyclase domain-containing protein [Burkholderiales bacterium]|nr:adenylate/guanylate cyclase domain-containing protein [Burkholderiales bacterium]